MPIRYGRHISLRSKNKQEGKAIENGDAFSILFGRIPPGPEVAIQPMAINLRQAVDIVFSKIHILESSLLNCGSGFDFSRCMMWKHVCILYLHEGLSTFY